MGKLLGKVAFPVLKNNYIYLESPFGDRTYKGKVEQHNGIDLQYRFPTTKLKDNKEDVVIAIYDGIVTKVTYSSSRGYYIEIKHVNGFISRYLHLKKGSIKVKVGQSVKQGQELAVTGMTGNADGVHLHLAILKNNKFVNPLPYVLGTLTFEGTKWEKGKEYITLYGKCARTSPKVAVNKAKYKNLKETIKYKFVKDSLGYAKYKIGVTIVLNEFKKDSKGNTWGRTGSLWLCVNDETGDQVKKL